MTHRNWTRLSNMTHRNWTRLSNMTHRNRTFLFNMTLTYLTQIIEPVFEYESKNWTFFMTQRIELFSEWLKDFVENDSKNQTFFWRWPKESNFFLLKICSKNCFSVWFTELKLFSALLKEWNIWVWLKELNFLWYDSHNWTLKNSKNWFSQLQELNFFWKTWLKEFFTLFSHITQRIELSRRWLKELNPSYKTQRLENFFTWLKDFNLLNMTQWIEPLLYMTQRIEPFLGIWLNGLNPLHERTQRIGHPKDYLTPTTKPFCLWLGELGLFFLLTQRIELFLKNITQKLLTWLTELNSVLEHDSPNWTFFEEYDS